MKKFSIWIITALLLISLCPTAMATEGENTGWAIMEYRVSQDKICKDDVVTVEVWLNGVGTSGLSEAGITPLLSSFNGASVVEQTSSYVRFEDARYMGTGNTFLFRIGNQQLALTIYECEEYKPSEEENNDQTTPVVQVGKTDQPAPIAKGQTTRVGLWVQNLTEHDLFDVTATVTPSGELMITDNSVTYPLGRIWNGNVAFFDVSVCAFGELTTAAQSLSVSIGYTYEKNGTMMQGTATQTVPLAATVSKSTETITASVPNVIISGYDYGQEKISAGTEFELKMEFQNTSSVKAVENIVMTIDPGTALAISGASNSYHFPSLAPGAAQSQNIRLQALPEAPSAPAVVTVKFSYEYLDNDARKTVELQQTVSLPVYQLDRFELTQENASVQAWQYEESFLTLSYLNKGKGTVYNVSAQLEGEIGAMSRVQNVGNVLSGENGTIDFIITPELAGEQTCKLIVTYEDDAMQVMTKEFTFDVFVNEAYVPEILPEEEMIVEEPAAKSGWVAPVAVSAAVLAAAATVIVLRVRKKKRAGLVDSFVFSDGTEDSNENI